MLKQKQKIAYLCLEFGVDNNLPFYAGGLGILAGDIIKQSADYGVSMIGVGLFYQCGYFKQEISDNLTQIETDENLINNTGLELLPFKFNLIIANQNVVVQIWKYTYTSNSTNHSYIYFLDTNLAENSTEICRISSHLYINDENIRIQQEILLGFGADKLFRLINYIPDIIHLNESAACYFLVKKDNYPDSKIVFTTHTPVPHGHRKYSVEFLKKNLEDVDYQKIVNFTKDYQTFNETQYCLDISDRANTVSIKHNQVTKKMFPNYKNEIKNVTNGIHLNTWISIELKELLGKYSIDWMYDNQLMNLSYRVSLNELELVFNKKKQDLFDFIEFQSGVKLDKRVFTIGFARRFDPYKRHDFLIQDLEKLNMLAGKYNGLQVIYAGKAYFGTGGESSDVNQILKVTKKNFPNLKIIFIPNYNIGIAQKLVSGVDLWLNNPEVGNEACGTSGMKAGVNGVPTLSTLDGWWYEFNLSAMNGFAIDGESEEQEHISILSQLDLILDLYFYKYSKWLKLRRSTMALTGGYFGAGRMLNQYINNIYNA